MTIEAEILLELRSIRELLQVLVAARPGARRSVVCAADREVLQVLRDLLCADPWIRPRLFTAAEVVAMARCRPELQVRLAVLGANQTRALGKLLARIEGQAVDGAVFARRSSLRGATIWQVSRVSQVSDTRNTRQSAAPRG